MLVGSFADRAHTLKTEEEIEVLFSTLESGIVKIEDPRQVYSEPQESELLDKGAFGEVFLVKRIVDDMKVVLKVSCRQDTHKYDNLIREATLMTSIQDENVLSCLEAYNWENRVWLFLPYMNLGKLTTLCLDRCKNGVGPFSESSCKYLIYRICHGLLAFHQRNILHRDIKSDNVFLTEEGDVKLADLGFSVFLSEENQERTT